MSFQVNAIRPVHQSVNAFYDAVAPEYDYQMTAADELWRSTMKNFFVQHVPHGNVLDFGGGTGLDTGWMKTGGYNIFFLEPSVNMRSVAKVRAPTNAKINFIEADTDFSRWTEDRLPFTEKMQGVLANFAVLNCIQHLELFFEKIALVADSGSLLAAMVLDPAFRSVWRMHSPVLACKLLFRSKVTILNKYREIYHPTYIHSRGSLVSCSAKYFELRSYSSLPPSGFAIMLFQRKS
jgi:ubiquinone/menaquinone biosynthesis C-methylase UbiE